MAEKTEDRMQGASGADGADPAATAMTLGGASRSEGFLKEQGVLRDKQSRVPDLQIDTLQKKDEFELSLSASDKSQLATVSARHG